MKTRQKHGGKQLVWVLAAVLISLIAQSFVPHKQSLSLSQKQVSPNVLAKREISLQDRYADKMVNDVFKDNILLTLAYTAGKIAQPGSINWKNVQKPGRYEIILYPQQVFAFHEDLLPEYKGKVVYTTNAHFNSTEGFKSDGYLVGDGVCHLASLINWAAQDAKLDVVAPTNHDFMVIPEIPREYGTSIYSSPGETAANAQQNLYVKNNNDFPVTLSFEYQNDTLSLTIAETNSLLSQK